MKAGCGHFAGPAPSVPDGAQPDTITLVGRHPQLARQPITMVTLNPERDSTAQATTNPRDSGQAAA